MRTRNKTQKKRQKFKNSLNINRANKRWTNKMLKRFNSECTWSDRAKLNAISRMGFSWDLHSSFISVLSSHFDFVVFISVSSTFALHCEFKINFVRRCNERSVEKCDAHIDANRVYQIEITAVVYCSVIRARWFSKWIRNNVLFLQLCSFASFPFACSRDPLEHFISFSY